MDCRVVVGFMSGLSQGSNGVHEWIVGFQWGS